MLSFELLPPLLPPLPLLQEKRQRQMAIENKRHQLEDKILQLQHHKSKAMRERWLLQGIPASSPEEEEARTKQVQADEDKAKKLEEAIRRLEVEIEQLESEESQIAAKEQVILEKLREAEKSIEDLQKSFSKPDGAMYAMEISVEKDKLTGESKVLSTTPVGTEGVHQRGVKVYDDGNKVMYEVCSGGAVVENGVHHLTTSEVDQLIHRTGRTNVVSKCVSEALTVSESSASPDDSRSGGDSGLRKDMVVKEVRHKAGQAGKVVQPIPPGEAPKASEDHPVTMIFMGYQNVEDQEETNRLLGYEGSMQAELVLIDEDDEKSLREKTVTDISTTDGNAAELVAGKSMTEASETLSAEENEGTDTAMEPVAGTDKKKRWTGASDAFQSKELDQSTEFGIAGTQQDTVKPPAKLLEDVTALKGKSRRSSGSDNPDHLSSGHEEEMEVDHHPSGPKSAGVAVPKVVPSEPASLDSAPIHREDKGHNGIESRHESLDSDVAKEIRYLDEVLEAICCEPVVENGSNVPPSPEPSPVRADGRGSPVSMAPEPSAPPLNGTVHVDGKEQQTREEGEVKVNGLLPSYIRVSSAAERNREQRLVESSRRSSRDGEPVIVPLKKEAKFELRAYHEDKKPSKLFTEDGRSEPYKIKKSRASDEIAELERARLEVIRSQVVKKNPSIAEKWKPPQEKTIEEQLDPDKLESHKKYAERKQRKQGGQLSPVSPKLKFPMFVPPDPIIINREDVVTEQIDFSAARKQFLKMDNAPEHASRRRPASTRGTNTRPALKLAEAPKRERVVGSGGLTETGGTQEHAAPLSGSEVSLVKASKVSVVPDEGESQEGLSLPWEGRQKEESCAEPPLHRPAELIINSGLRDEVVGKVCVDDEGFTRVRAVLTVLNEDGDSDISDHCFKYVSLPSTAEEVDSGLDDLSLRSQDTTVMETLSNDFSIDNVSDSGASNEMTNVSLDFSLGGSQEFSQPQTPQALTPVDRERDESSYKREGTLGSLSDDELYKQRSPLPLNTEQQLHYQAEMLVQKAIQLALAQESHVTTGSGGCCQTELQRAVGSEGVHITPQAVSAAPLVTRPPPEQDQRPQAPMNGDRMKEEVQSGRLEDDCFLFPTATARQCVTTETGSGGSHPSLYRPEFSPFSDIASYMEPTDYSRNNVFVSHSQEPEVIAQSGPFKLRSRRQKTLSMIEQEIRAAQDREEELRHQREVLKTVQSLGRRSRPLPSPPGGLSKPTAPGKIEKSGPVSPMAEGPLPSPRSDATSVEQEYLGQSRSRGLMETLLEDYEVQKVKRRERRDDTNME
ncbi:A-kinase anchor protein 2-like isoform X4 [Leucoraja erinacea]|uniref:A-kinase anchor protein 2-like isoform X4 n=1 Tax=Leucoraja erinaceus TaxID=7782 RepID=UPI002457C344|nr:A-kinase anchor protein 2-like isoform X4 [Leucoraja erinacea]